MFDIKISEEFEENLKLILRTSQYLAKKILTIKNDLKAHWLT